MSDGLITRMSMLPDSWRSHTMIEVCLKIQMVNRGPEATYYCRLSLRQAAFWVTGLWRGLAVAKLLADWSSQTAIVIKTPSYTTTVYRL